MFRLYVLSSSNLPICKIGCSPGLAASGKGTNGFTLDMQGGFQSKLELHIFSVLFWFQGELWTLCE